MNEIHDLSAVELLQRYRAKTLSPTEVFAAVEQHIARWEPHLKALYAYDPEGARREAAAATWRWMKGAPNGPLDNACRLAEASDSSDTNLCFLRSPKRSRKRDWVRESSWARAARRLARNASARSSTSAICRCSANGGRGILIFPRLLREIRERVVPVAKLAI